MFEQVSVGREVYGAGTNLLLCGSVMNLPKEIERLKGKVQCVYLDPPFMTGERFERTRPYGEKGWKKGTPVARLAAYEDRYTAEREYRKLLRKLIHTAHDLLSGTGVFYLHLDWRMTAQARALCDQEFGKDLFLNEIIWGYESGGRSKKFFPRKHDSILMYAKTRKYRFDITRVPLDRQAKRKNHMARGIDEQGRAYSSIVSNGKEYRYYDDTPVYPGDVWTDISHLQQRDPERTGYATQKPLKLLDRMLRPVTEPGDWVVDLCCGSGTTLEAAQKLGCRFAGMDVNPEAVAVALARLAAEDLTVICPEGKTKAPLLTEEDPAGRFRILGVETEHPGFPKNTAPLDSLESWEYGTIEEGVFRPLRSFRRSWKYPELVNSLKLNPAEITAVMTTDAAGIRRLYRRKA